MNEVIHPDAAIRGSVRPYRVVPEDCTPNGFPSVFQTSSIRESIGGDVHLPGHWKAVGSSEHNDVMYDWASIVGELLRNAPDRKPYHIGGMFFEFENNGGAAVSAPSFSRDGGIDYYAGLLTSANRDYLRVPLTGVTLTSTNESLFPSGNELSFFAQTEGVTGVHGKEFNDVVQSRIFGGALVAFPDFGDATQDLVFSRFYFADTANQLVKLVGSQVGFSWHVILN